MTPQLVIFGIQAGIKLGNELNRILVDRSVHRPLIFPVGDTVSAQDLLQSAAVKYFRKHRATLVDGGGVYAHVFVGGRFDPEICVEPYLTLQKIDGLEDHQGNPSDQAAELAAALHEIKQTSEDSAGARSMQRFMGVLIEIGIDYFAAQPHLLAGDSSSRKILSAFVENLQDVDFSNPGSESLLEELFLVSLRTLESQASLVSDDQRTSALIGGISKALVTEFDTATTKKREDFLKRILTSTVRGGAQAIADHSDLFLPENEDTRQLVETTVRQVLVGLQDQEHLFSNESVELIIWSALKAAGKHADILTKDERLQFLIKSSLTALTTKDGGKVFEGGDDKEMKTATVAAILQGALTALRDHPDAFLGTGEDPDKSELLPTTISALAGSLLSTQSDDSSLKGMLTRDRLIALTGIVFQEVARDPEALLRAGSSNPKRTVIAQAIGSIAEALGGHPEQLVSADGFLELTKTAASMALLNAGQLLDLGQITPKKNLLFKISQAAISGIAGAKTTHDNDNRQLLNRVVVLDILQRVLTVSSANAGPFLEDSKDQRIAQTIIGVVGLANGDLKGRINGANLPILIEKILIPVLWDELKPDNKLAFAQSAHTLLRSLAA